MDLLLIAPAKPITKHKQCYQQHRSQCVEGQALGHCLPLRVWSCQVPAGDATGGAPAAFAEQRQGKHCKWVERGEALVLPT